jgi:hypothetical protein
VKWIDGLRQNREDGIRMREAPVTAIAAKHQRENQEAEERRELLRQLQTEQHRHER